MLVEHACVGHRPLLSSLGPSVKPCIYNRKWYDGRCEVIVVKQMYVIALNNTSFIALTSKSIIKYSVLSQPYHDVQHVQLCLVFLVSVEGLVEKSFFAPVRIRDRPKPLFLVGFGRSRKWAKTEYSVMAVAETTAETDDWLTAVAVAETETVWWSKTIIKHR